MEKFIIDGRYGQVLIANGINPSAVLKAAGLPIDTFAHQRLKLTEADYFKMIDSIDSLAENPLLPTKLAATGNIETFSPPIFAAYCSKNGEQFLQRLAHYKALICPVTYQIKQEKKVTTITLVTSDIHEPLPPFFIKGEFTFMVQLLAKATKEVIKPCKITTTFSENDASIQDYFGLSFTLDTSNAITFSNSDLQIPFISENTSILEYLEPELKKRLADLDIDDSYGKRVRNVLVEILPRGEFSIEDVARALGISKRTLQRKLKGENTNFQQQLNATREMLAKNYLLNTSMTADDIAFLLAYQETNSFLRAFNTWTGMSVQKYREQHN